MATCQWCGSYYTSLVDQGIGLLLTGDAVYCSAKCRNEAHAANAPKEAYDNGEESYRSGDYAHAIKQFNTYMTFNTDNANAYYYRGDCYRMLGQYDKAIEDFNETIELGSCYCPDKAYSSRGESYRNLGQYENAINDFDKSIELYPNNVFAYSSRGETYRMLNETDKAINDLNAAIKLDANNSFAYGSRGVAYMQKGQKKQAISDLEKAVNLNSNYSWAVNQLAEARKMNSAPEAPRATASGDVNGSFCTECGTHIEAGGNFCPSCGRAVSGAASQQAELSDDDWIDEDDEEEEQQLETKEKGAPKSAFKQAKDAYAAPFKRLGKIIKGGK